MKPLILLLLLTVTAFGQPPIARPLDLSGVTEADIIATVEHMQQLVHLAENKQASAESAASDLVFQLTLAGSDLQKIQATLDTRTQERDKAVAEAAIQRKWKWRWFWIAAAEGLILAALAYLKLKP